MLCFTTGQSNNHFPQLNRVLVLVGGLFFLTMTGFAQVSAKLDTTVYTIVEKQPEFPGGRQALNEYLQTNVKYPIEAQKAKIKGRSLVSFIVNTDGSIKDVRALSELGYGCEEEAIRVVKAMPHWLSGSQSGRLIRVKLTLPIEFGMDISKRKGN